MNARALLRFAAPLAALLLAAPIAAQDEPSLRDLARDLQTKLTEAHKLLKAQEDDLARRLELLDKLTDAGLQIAKSAPRTGRDEAAAAIEEARVEALREPPIEGELAAVLDRAEVELGREPIGELRGAAAARFVAELVPFAVETNTLLALYLQQASAMQQLVKGFADLGTREAQGASVGLKKLYEIQRRTFALQEPGAR